MLPSKIKKISLKNEYPCPCRRNGCLKPIILTEALGCDRCQQIFVVQENAQVIEQLSSIYQKKTWRWTGNRWKSLHPRLTSKSIPALLLTITLLVVILAMVLFVMLQKISDPGIMVWGIACLLLIIFIGLAFWLAYRY